MAWQFDPNIYFQKKPFDPFQSIMSGLAMGQQLKEQQQRIGLANLQSQQLKNRQMYDKNLMNLGQYYDTDQFIPEALKADPNVAENVIRQTLDAKLAGSKVKSFQADNEWTTDPNDPNKEIYVQVRQDPESGQPLYTPIPDKFGGTMSRIRAQSENLAFKKTEMEEKQKQFEQTLDLKNKDQLIEYAKLKNEVSKLDMQKAEFNAREAKEKAGIELDYSKELEIANRGLSVIDRMIGSEDGKIKRHPGFKGSIGLKGGALAFGLKEKPVAGTPESDFMALYDQIGGQAFLQAMGSLKGSGQISEIEGKKATQAVLDMNTSQSEAAFIEAANRFRSAYKKGIEKSNEQKRMKLAPYKNTSDVNNSDKFEYKINSAGKKVKRLKSGGPWQLAE